MLEMFRFRSFMASRKAIRRSVPPGELPAFTPVPRKLPRHDGWTPERQKAMLEALADTGCVAIACRMVNMSTNSFYQLRRQPGATSFRAAADAAQTLGLQPVKDEAFHRAMHGQLVPVFVGGKLMGFRRKKNDRLLMFILRHYGQDAQGRKTTVNYFSTRASAGAATQNPSPLRGEGDSRSERGEGESRALAASEASTTTVRTVITGPDRSPASIGTDDEAANILGAFEGVPLDAEAQGQIYRALEACAERRRALEGDPEADPDCDFVRVAPGDLRYLGELESGSEDDWVEYRPDGEHDWEGLGEGGEAGRIDEVLAGMAERKALALPPSAHPELVEGSSPAHPEALEGPAHPEEKPAPAEAGEGPAPETAEGAPDRDPGPRQPKRPYKKRQPKPPFTPPDEVRRAQAAAEVEAERRLLAEAEAERRKARARRDHERRRESDAAHNQGEHRRPAGGGSRSGGGSAGQPAPEGRQD